MSFERRGVVSIWVFLHPWDPADTGKDMLKEFAGVDTYDLDFQEAVFSESSREVPLTDLVPQLSYAESFAENVRRSAKRKGIEKAVGVVAQYDFAYDPKVVDRPIRQEMVFLGYFSWHDDE